MGKLKLLDGVEIFSHDCFEDHRGQLYTLWEQNEIPNIVFNHDKIAISNINVLRGLHTDKSWKLISCIHGSIQLVVVNYDKKSNEYLDWCEFILDSDTKIKKSILVPPGFLNGHLILSNQAIFHYKWSYQGDYPDVKDQTSVNWADPKIGINWLCSKPILSDRDKNTILL